CGCLYPVRYDVRHAGAGRERGGGRGVIGLLVGRAVACCPSYGAGTGAEGAAARVAQCLLFFFQAEDGIRDKLVTGVQTCALPISRSTSRSFLVAVGSFSTYYERKEQALAAPHADKTLAFKGGVEPFRKTPEKRAPKEDRKSVV